MKNFQALSNSEMATIVAGGYYVIWRDTSQSSSLFGYNIKYFDSADAAQAEANRLGCYSSTKELCVSCAIDEVVVIP